MFLKVATGLVALSMFAISATDAHAEWLKARSKHFIVYADTSESDLRNRTERLERFDSMMRLLFSVDDTVPVTVFMMPSVRDVQNLAKNRKVAGFYSASAQLAYGFVPERLSYETRGFTAETVSMHEYGHHMLLGGTDRYIPGWATEGLAEFFMTARLDRDGSITIGGPNDARSAPMFGAHRWTVEELLTSDDRKISKDETIQKYSRGWAMVHYLWMSGKRPGEYAAFIAELNKTGDALASGKKVFGDLDKLDKEINAYLRASSFPASKLTAEQLNTPSDISISKLSEGEAAILDYRMRSLLGVTEETAPVLAAEARPVAARYPNDPFVQRTLAEIEYDAKQYDDADIAADRALAADPDNLMAMAYKGRIGVQRAMKAEDVGDWDAARGWLLKANRVDPNNPLPFVLFYDSFLAAGEVPPEGAVGGLYRAVVLMPQDITLRARAAVELIRSGDRPKARSVLAPAAFSPHAPQDNPMRKLIEKIDAGLSQDALLDYIHDEKLDRRYNDFFAASVYKEDEEKEKEKEKGDDA